MNGTDKIKELSELSKMIDKTFADVENEKVRTEVKFFKLFLRNQIAELKAWDDNPSFMRRVTEVK